MAAMCWRFNATVTVEARITSFAHLTDPAEAERCCGLARKVDIARSIHFGGVNPHVE
jgi:hypothetical protein